MYRAKTLVHTTLGSAAIPRTVPITVYINPNEALKWFNESNSDPSYVEQIVESLGTTEWLAVQEAIEKNGAVEKNPTPKEVCIKEIKYTYIVKPIARTYSLMSASDGKNYLPIPMATVEIVVHACPKHLALTSNKQPLIEEFIDRN